jgi:hypothetical protein
VPDGAAPLNIRQAWLGTELFAVKLPESEQLDLMTGQPNGVRESYGVLKIPALKALDETSREAADWFRIHVPVEIPVFTFGINEVEVLPASGQW